MIIKKDIAIFCNFAFLFCILSKNSYISGILNIMHLSIIYPILHEITKAKVPLAVDMFTYCAKLYPDF
jgi:hypothetical protein